MPVEVRLPTILRSHAGGAPSVTVEGSTVGELFDGLVAKYPGLKGQLVTDSGDLHKFVNVYRNDDDIRYTGGLDTPVEDNDVVSIIPAVAGG
jgi:MoaD family protein